MKTFRYSRAIVAIAAVLTIFSCATQKKLKNIQEGNVSEVQLNLSNEVTNMPEVKATSATRDTLKIKDDDGTEILIGYIIAVKFKFLIFTVHNFFSFS